jgi:acyl-CoA synthetase (AMP-forming)/AMP-acid ligase II
MEFSVAAIDGVRKGSVVAFGDTVKDDTQLVIVIETVIVDDDARKALDQAIRTTIFNNFNLPVKEVVLLSPGGVPKTTSGKIQRQSCKKQYLNDELGQSIVLPRYWLAQRLAQSVASIIRNRVQRVVHLKIDRLRRFANLNQYKAAE